MLLITSYLYCLCLLFPVVSLSFILSVSLSETVHDLVSGDAVLLLSYLLLPSCQRFRLWARARFQ